MLAILTTHPIQYQVPIWKALADRGRVPFKVYYMSDQGLAARHDPGFGRSVAWDIDLTSGYDHTFIPDIITGPQQSSFWWLRLRSGFGQRIASDGAEVVWVQGWQVAAYWQAIWQANAVGLKIWLRGDTNLRSTGQGWRRALKGPLLKQLFDRVDTFLCVGEANRQFYKAYGVSRYRLASAPHCVKNSRFAREADELRSQRDAIRQRWGIPENAACVLFVGKLISKKRPLDLAVACRRLARESTDRPVHLLYVGTGALLEDIRAECRIVYDFDKANENGAVSPENDGTVPVSLVGFLNQGEIAQAYVAADCLALPSEATETWGLVVNEAMASGLPAVVSDAVGCSDDLIKPVRPDLCFALGDRLGLADALAACLNQPPSQAELKSLIERYDVLRTVETVEALYGDLNAGARAMAEV